MLGFLRKHQKLLLGTVAFFMTISMVFFGTMGGSMGGPKEAPDRQIGTLYDGSPLMEKEVDELARLISMGEWGKTPNLLSGNWMEREILLSGLGEAILEEHFDEMQEDLQARWDRVRSYSPYRHPHAAQISARAVWETFAPSIPELLDEARSGPAKFGKEQLGQLFALYRAQSAFPPHLLHQMLYYSQGEQVRHDPGFAHANLALFGFQSVSDWFGPEFERKVSEVVLNGALMAKEKGVRIDSQRALGQMFANVQNGLKEIGQEEQDPKGAFVYLIRQRGLTQERASLLWGKALAFSHLMEKVGEATDLDQVPFAQFNDFSKEKFLAKRYSVPEALKDGEKLASYLAIVADECEGLPLMYRDPKVVLESYPEMVYRSFEIGVKKVDEADVFSRIPLKETWAFERSEEGFGRLKEEFPNLKSVNDLENLDSSVRFVVDQRAREMIGEKHPEWMEEAYADAEQERQWIKVSGAEMDGWEDEFDRVVEVLDDSSEWQFFTYLEADERGLLEEGEASAEDRVASHVEQVRAALMEGREVDWGQWSLSSQEMKLRETQLAVGGVSEVDDGSFFQVVSVLDTGPDADQVERAKQAIARDAKKAFLVELMRK